MTIEKQAIYPIVIAEKFTFGNLLRAILDSPVARTRIRTGTVGVDGKTVITKKGTLLVNTVAAKPGERVVMHEIM